MTDLKAIQFKRTKTAGAKPAAEKLLEGELAINLKDRTLFTKDDKGTVIDLGFAKGGQVDGDISQTGNFTTTGTISGNKVVSTQAPVDASDLTRKDYVDQEIKKIIGDSQTNIDDLEKKVTLVDTKVDQNDLKQTEAVNTVKSSVSNLDTKVDLNDQKQTEALISAITGVNFKLDDGLNLKLDKTGGTLTGNLNITGQLQVGQSTHLGDGNILGPSWTLGGGNLYSHIDTGLNSKFNVTGGVLNGDLTANTIISDAGAITIKDSPNGNHHLWFNSRDGGEKGLIYATPEGVLRLRSGTSGSVGHIQIDSGLLHCTGNLSVAGTTDFGSNITFSSGITTNGNSTFNGQNDFAGNSNYSGGITFVGVNRTQYPISHTDGRPSSNAEPLQLRRVRTWSQGNWMYEAATSSQGGLTDGISWFLNSTGSSSTLFSISSKGQIGIGPDNSSGAVVYKTGDIRGSAWGGGTLKEWLDARGIK